MKISYNSLKQYVDFTESPEEISEILTDTGLEVEGIEVAQAVKGSMKGLVIGQVVTCEQHSNADKLHVTTVNIGTGENLSIVCGAPNVEAGMKVVVATVGTILYDGDKSFPIKKSKMRGEPSNGMLCGEVEIGVGTDETGIIKIADNAVVGTPAAEYYNLVDDTIIEIGLTPNRADGASHIGVARDLVAYFRHIGKHRPLKKPCINAFEIETTDLTIPVYVESKACPRYAGVTISGIKVAPSPDWLQVHLRTLGLSPINNVVDITNFVLHETGQPLHAFDAQKILGGKIIVKTLPTGTPFTTLDGIERKLHEEDLMICNTKEPMCIAGVFGGIKSGVSTETTSIFIESAYFDAVSVRKTSKRHSLQTDASFRFERGTDPNNVIYALQRAAILIKELAGGVISSEIQDIYPTPVIDLQLDVKFSHIDRLIGKKIPHQTIKNILAGLEIRLIEKHEDTMTLEIPAYRVDVTREADVIEEILRIYGYNNVEISQTVHSALAYEPKPNEHKLRNKIADLLSSNGFSEAMSNSLTKESYYEKGETFKLENTIKILNPLSADLSAMRQTLLFGGMEAIIRNINYKNADIQLYEFGNIYTLKNTDSKNLLKKYHEQQELALFISGNTTNSSWNHEAQKADFFYLKAQINKIFTALHFNLSDFKTQEVEEDIFAYGLEHIFNGKTIVKLGAVSKKYLSGFGINQDVFYANINWTNVLKLLPGTPQFAQIAKFPAVKRDLSLLIDKQVKFADIKAAAFKAEKKLLKDVTIFDVFEDAKLGENKKSYAINFLIQNESKTLKDKEIDKIMKKIIASLEHNFKAELR